ncbi:MAG TPA: DsbA family oxidoreductase [Burkholderiales bacterium]|jgi:predicted DsbA family dithiol-disulfide isomerase|nr:DsbA family oxidoreductase [Burkholderiales bacterium]
MTLRIDILSDVVCPWCFIGKRHLERALAMYRERHYEAPAPVVRWHPFQLNPDLPASGTPRAQYVARKFGGPQRAAEIYARVAAAGARAGIAFAFDRIEVQPNTLDAHRLMHRAGELGIQDAMAESLFAGYFLEGRDFTDPETLADLAQRAGMARGDARRYLVSNEDRALVVRQDAHARDSGIEGVPFFIFGERLAVSGAQPPEVLLEAMERAAPGCRAAATQ